MGRLTIRNCRAFGHPRSDSIVISSGRIVEVGCGLWGDRVTNLAGAFVLPGFNDAHIRCPSAPIFLEPPVKPIDLRRGLYAAVTCDGPERLTMDQAIRCYTAGSAFAEFTENEKGQIAPGMLAELVALAEDPREVEPDALLKIENTATLFVGERVHPVRQL